MCRPKKGARQSHIHFIPVVFDWHLIVEQGIVEATKALDFFHNFEASFCKRGDFFSFIMQNLEVYNFSPWCVELIRHIYFHFIMRLTRQIHRVSINNFLFTVNSLKKKKKGGNLTHMHFEQHIIYLCMNMKFNRKSQLFRVKRHILVILPQTWLDCCINGSCSRSEPERSHACLSSFIRAELAGDVIPESNQ